ncbi:MAG: tRNA G18 (ribose-2'-O)-methylase SpoU [Myxococcota bacterium]
MDHLKYGAQLTEYSHQITGATAVAAALEHPEDVALLLVRRGSLPPRTAAMVEAAQLAGVAVRFESTNDLRRMSRSEPPADVLALVGRRPSDDLDALISGPGAVWLLSEVAYPSNVGTILRTVEVAGAAGVVVDGPFNRPERLRALRVSMRVDRFMPVLFASSESAVSAARQAGRAVIAIESSGTVAPWEVDLTGRPLLILGGEREGIPQSVLEAADQIIRLPMPGFIPSFNVQAAAAAVAAERLRQVSASR